MTLTQIKPAGLSKPVDLADNEKIRLGTGNDLEIYHDGSNSRIKDTGQGNLIVNASRFDVVNVADNEYIATFAQDGAVELYHNGSKKFQTNGAGVDVFQNLYLGDNVNLKFGTGADLQIFHNGTHSRLINSTGNLELAGSQIDITDTALSQYAARFDTNDSVDLYFNGSKKFETTSTGAVVTGNLSTTGSISSGGNLSLVDTGAVILGTSNDCTLSHSATNTIIDNNTGDLILRCDGDDVKILAEDDIVLRDNDDSTNFIHCVNGGAVDLYHNGSKKFETTSGGALVTGNFYLNDNGELTLGTGGDLKIYHDGTHSYITNNTGTLYNFANTWIINNYDNKKETKT